MWKWNLHRSSEVEVMQAWWYRRECEAVLVEGKQRRQVYTIGINLVVCGE